MLLTWILPSMDYGKDRHAGIAQRDHPEPIALRYRSLILCREASVVNSGKLNVCLPPCLLFCTNATERPMLER